MLAIHSAGGAMPDPADVSQLLSGEWASRQPEAFQRALIDIVVWRHVEAGTTINHAADEAGGLWGLARGQIDVASALSEPGSPVGDLYLPGQWAGIGPIFGRPRGADGTARVASLVAIVPLQRLQGQLQANPGWWECLGQLATYQVFRYGGAIGDLLIRDARRRCIAVLLRLADCRHRNPAAPPTIIVNHADLAAAANMSRHPAGEILRELDALGLIDLGYGKVTIIDAAKLRAIVDDK
jgi:CRP/FNR family transcriptional regulator, cyclic AMP receptor protein